MTDLEVQRQYDFDVLEKRHARKLASRKLIAPAVVVAVILVGAGSYLVNYMPLASGAVWRTKDDCTHSLGPYSHRGLGDTFRVIETDCVRDGERVSWGFSIRNTGPLPIRVLEFDTTMPSFMDEATVSVASINGIRNIAPFSPFQLRKGEERWIQMVSRMNGCNATQFGTGSTRYGWRVSYEIGPLTRSDTYYGAQFHAECPFPEPSP